MVFSGGPQPYRGDLIALTRGDLEPHIMEFEFLTDRRDMPAFINNQPGQRRGLIIRKLQAQQPVQIAQGHCTFSHIRPVRLLFQIGKINICLIINIPDDFF